MRIPRGYIVSLEGIDATGKKTQSRLLSRWLAKNGFKTSEMSFPDYQTAIGRQIRSFLNSKAAYPPQVQHLLFAANRWEKLGQIRSRLAAGEAVVINRYTESNLAYGSANGLDVAWLSGLEEGLPKSDLVVVLDASPKSTSSRRPSSVKDRYEKSTSIQTKAQNAYRELAEGRGWKIIDAAGSVDEVHRAVVASVKEALGKDRGISI